VSIVEPQATRTERARVAEPSGPWKWSQQWRDVLFLHWPVDADQLRSRLPPALEIDTFEGQTWVSFVGFRLQVRLRNFPHIPFVSDCLELNFRTYVRFRGEPAIMFLTMDADHPLIVATARWTTPLPYSLAKIEYRRQGRCGDLSCHPVDQSRPRLTASFSVGDDLGTSAKESLDAWLLERYRAFAADQRHVYRLVVRHEPWKLRSINVTACEHSVVSWGLDGAPRAHYSDGVSALLWPFETVV